MFDDYYRYYIKSDLPLAKSVTNVEGSIFATTDRHIAKHDFGDDEILFVNGKHGYEIISMDDLPARKALLTKFNKCIKERTEDNVLRAVDFAYGQLEIFDDFMFEEDDEGDITYFDGDELMDLFIKWATGADRVGVVIQHSCELAYPPHVHMLYQRERGRCEEFQLFCEDYYTKVAKGLI